MVKAKIVNLRSTSQEFNPNIPDPEDRPRCSRKGCGKPRAIVTASAVTGQPFYRKICGKHHNEVVAKRQGLTVTEYAQTKLEARATAVGMTVINYNNRNHPSRQYRKDYCENFDGHVTRHKCTTTIVWNGQLDVDHIDGNPSHNDPSNLQTLCKCCHAHKTFLYEDARTPGRKALGIRQ